MAFFTKFHILNMIIKLLLPACNTRDIGKDMLIEFTIKNYRSIKEEQRFSLVKAKGNELEESNTFLAEGAAIPLLRSAVIYGANAAGKSNLLRALMAMERMVRVSASKMQEGDRFSLTPFLFDDKTPDEPSEFEAVFISEGVKYQYGFCATQKTVLQEWLIAYPKGRPQRWFSRAFDVKANEYDYKFSEHLSGAKNLWQSVTRENALFLSAAVQFNSEQLKPVFNWFKETLKSVDINGVGAEFTASRCETEASKKEILHFLQSADFAIDDIQIESKPVNFDSLSEHFSDEFKEKIVNKLKNEQFLDVRSVHKTASGKFVPLDFLDESDGTQKFFSFVGPWIDVLKNGYVLVIDELHNNLHPKMVEYLVSLFHNTKTNPNNAQLIFTTHETSILNQDVFRRDQIWFCEKNKDQESELYPLSDFSPKKGRENIELGYLSGRYGALPFINALTDFGH